MPIQVKSRHDIVFKTLRGSQSQNIPDWILWEQQTIILPARFVDHLRFIITNIFRNKDQIISKTFRLDWNERGLSLSPFAFKSSSFSRVPFVYINFYLSKLKILNMTCHNLFKWYKDLVCFCRTSLISYDNQNPWHSVKNLSQLFYFIVKISFKL